MEEIKVALTAAEGYTENAIGEAIRRQFALLGIGEAIKPGMRVALKPNLVMKRAPEGFTTTHPLVVECAAREAFRSGAGEVVIIDSPGGPFTRQALAGIYKTSGMEGAAQNTGAVLNEDVESVHVPCSSCRVCSGFPIIRGVAEADLVINLPKLKSHCMMTLSGAVKNLFGCVPGLQKPEMHYRFPDDRQFSDMLVDLALTVAPAFTIVDAVVSMEGDGPTGGTEKKTGFLAGSADLFALDTVLGQLMCLDGIPALERARERGLVPEAGRIVLEGDPIEKNPFQPPKTKSTTFLERFPSFLRPVVMKVATKAAQPFPKVDFKRCVGCGKCAESCPAHTIEIQQGKARIHKERCIHCYCCHEMCPVKAIDIRRFFLFHL